MGWWRDSENTAHTQKYAQRAPEGCRRARLPGLMVLHGGRGTCTRRTPGCGRCCRWRPPRSGLDGQPSAVPTSPAACLPPPAAPRPRAFARRPAAGTSWQTGGEYTARDCTGLRVGRGRCEQRVIWTPETHGLPGSKSMYGFSDDEDEDEDEDDEDEDEEEEEEEEENCRRCGSTSRCRRPADGGGRRQLTCRRAAASSAPAVGGAGIAIQQPCTATCLWTPRSPTR